MLKKIKSILILTLTALICSTIIYLVNKVIRMIFAFAVIIGEIFFAKKGILPFVIGFFALYVLTIIYESVFFVQIEKKLNETA